MLPTFSSRPPRWLAVKSQNISAVQHALGLHNAKPCSWQKALSGDEKVFIAPPVSGDITIIMKTIGNNARPVRTAEKLWMFCW